MAAFRAANYLILINKVFLMNSFTHREKIVFFVFTLIAILLLGNGIFKFVANELAVWEFVNMLAVSLIFLGTGLSPKVFFTPFKQLFSVTYKPETIINSKLQQMILFTGLLIALICVVQQVYW